MTFLLEALQAELKQIDQSIIQRILLVKESSPNDYRGCKTIAELLIKVNGESTVLTVGFPDAFPSELPKFFDKDDRFGVIPHKEIDGLLCFTRNESLVIDERYPASILLNCLEKVIQLIELGLKGANELDYILEFEAYWRRESITNLYGYIDTNNPSVRMLDLWWKKMDDKKLILAAEKNQSLEQAVNQIFHINTKDASMYRCIYFPLEPGTFFKPPLEKEKWEYSTLKKNIFNNLSSPNQKKFREILRSLSDQFNIGLEFIIIGLPLPNGNVALFGYVIGGYAPIQNKNSRNTALSRLHPLVQKPKDMKMFEVQVNRWHPDHLLNRTGGNTALTNKHILIVGVGSVGSEVAIRFAKAGVHKISLVDYDRLELENVHRHALGSDQVFGFSENIGLYNKSKVWGIKEEINRKYPFTQVEVFPSTFSKVWDEGKINWSNTDLIVVAIGSPNQEMLINRKMAQLSKAPPVIYTWVEPLGIGGHTLVTLNGVSEGCYQCLFQSDEEKPIYNRSAFAKPFQEFSKTVTGCGSVFTPYNFMDSERTAMLTVEMGIKVLMGEIHDNPLCSWKGDDQLFQIKGFKTTPRFSFSVEKLYASRFLYKNPNCPVCSREGGDPY